MADDVESFDFDNFAAHEAVLQLLWDEEIRRESVQVGQNHAATSRATVLVSAASLTAGLVSGNAHSLWTTLAVVTGAFAAICGAFALTVFTNVNLINLVTIYPKIYHRDKATSLFLLIRDARQAARDRVRSTTIRVRIIRVGYILLAATVALIAVSFLFK